MMSSLSHTSVISMDQQPRNPEPIIPNIRLNIFEPADAGTAASTVGLPTGVAAGVAAVGRAVGAPQDLLIDPVIGGPSSGTSPVFGTPAGRAAATDAMAAAIASGVGNEGAVPHRQIPPSAGDLTMIRSGESLMAELGALSASSGRSAGAAAAAADAAGGQPVLTRRNSGSSQISSSAQVCCHAHARAREPNLTPNPNLALTLTLAGMPALLSFAPHRVSPRGLLISTAQGWRVSWREACRLTRHPPRPNLGWTQATDWLGPRPASRPRRTRRSERRASSGAFAPRWGWGLGVHQTRDSAATTATPYRELKAIFGLGVTVGCVAVAVA
jgi:hypothetical protein